MVTSIVDLVIKVNAPGLLSSGYMLVLGFEQKISNSRSVNLRLEWWFPYLCPHMLAFGVKNLNFHVDTISIFIKAFFFLLSEDKHSLFHYVVMAPGRSFLYARKKLALSNWHN